ncbi:hypothetical protein, partial [Elizabethkingia meningoseptica]|uniref:hypothetical protein n=1 Tax=Elizabethkingia meningoseptica TaxID=238 RepID=UPI001C885499
NIERVKKKKIITINNKNITAVCLEISKIVKNYSFTEYLNKKYQKYSNHEVLTILLKKNKIKISYNSDENEGLLSIKFNEIAKVLDE